MTIQHTLLQRRYSFSRIQPLGACFGTVHDCVTSEKLETVIQHIKTLLRELITRILDPPECLHQNSWTEILIRVPPITRTRRTTTSTKNTFVHTIKFLTILLGLKILLLELLLLSFLLKPRFDRSILIVKIVHIWNKILHDVHVRKRINLHLALLFDIA